MVIGFIFGSIGFVGFVIYSVSKFGFCGFMEVFVCEYDGIGLSF